MNKVLSAVTAFFKRVSSFANSNTGKKALDTALTVVEHSGPVIKLAGELVTKIATPDNPLDDLAFGAFVAKYPNFFNGKLNYTPSEMKTQAFILASDMLETKYGISTSAARAAVQAVYAETH